MGQQPSTNFADLLSATETFEHNALQAILQTVLPVLCLEGYINYACDTTQQILCEMIIRGTDGTLAYWE